MGTDNGKYNGKWIWILMDEQMDFIMEMKMDTEKFNLITKNEFDI